MWGLVRLGTVAVDGSYEVAGRVLVEEDMSKIEKGGGSMGVKDRCVVGGDLVGKRELVEVGLGALLVRRAFVGVLFLCRLRLGAFVVISLGLVSPLLGGLGFGVFLLAPARLVSVGLVGLVIVVSLRWRSSCVVVVL